ncbi:phosphatase PAP2 family protein [Sphingobacterium sp. UBA1498]|uniref:phosphatase PAP2 family protein n=1 Tax=Sphingobacterium sp. UBA1498 TaxID=1947481 RepID=UPI0025D7B03D|nr:phosphatase PAP2 family protein [Sphingobacterium sp. UBA1498]
MLKNLLSSILLIYLHQGANAQPRESVKTSTDVQMFTAPAAGFITTLALKDYKVNRGLISPGPTSIAVTYILKYTIKKQRPDHSDTHSFPSNHTAISFQGASFIAQRYGGKYSLPAYLISGYVGWGRIYSKRNDTADVIAGAAIGIGSALICTRRLLK